MLELYHSNMSVCSQKVRLVLAEKGLSWTSHVLDLRGGSGDQFKPEYLRLNPRAEVPTLVHDGRPIRESTLINEYIEEVWPSPPLQAGDALQKHAIRLWTKIPDDGLHRACADITYISSIRDMMSKSSPEQVRAQLSGSPDLQKRERLREAIEMGAAAPMARYALAFYHRTLTEMEAALMKTSWLAGDAYSLADVALTPYVTRLKVLGMDEMWADLPKTADWLARVRARDNYAAAVTEFSTAGQLQNWRDSGVAVWPELRKQLATLKGALATKS